MGDVSAGYYTPTGGAGGLGDSINGGLANSGLGAPGSDLASMFGITPDYISALAAAQGPQQPTLDQQMLAADPTGKLNDDYFRAGTFTGPYGEQEKLDGHDIQGANPLTGLLTFIGTAVLPLIAGPLAPILAGQLGVSTATAQALIGAAGGALSGGAKGGVEGALTGGLTGGIGSIAGTQLGNLLGGAAGTGGTLVGNAGNDLLTNTVSPLTVTGAQGGSTLGGVLGGAGAFAGGSGGNLGGQDNMNNDPLTNPAIGNADQAALLAKYGITPTTPTTPTTVAPVTVTGPSSGGVSGLGGATGGVVGGALGGGTPAGPSGGEQPGDGQVNSGDQAPSTGNPLLTAVGQGIGNVGTSLLTGLLQGGIGSGGGAPAAGGGAGGGGAPAKTGGVIDYFPAPVANDSTGAPGAGAAGGVGAPSGGALLSTGAAAAGSPAAAAPDFKLQGSLAPDIYPWRKSA